MGTMLRTCFCQLCPELIHSFNILIPSGSEPVLLAVNGSIVLSTSQDTSECLCAERSPLYTFALFLAVFASTCFGRRESNLLCWKMFPHVLLLLFMIVYYNDFAFKIQILQRTFAFLHSLFAHGSCGLAIGCSGQNSSPISAAMPSLKITASVEYKVVLWREL